MNVNKHLLAVSAWPFTMDTPPAGGDHSEGNAILTISIVTLIAAFACVCLRCFIRIRLISNFWWDDGAVVLALVRSVPSTGIEQIS